MSMSITKRLAAEFAGTFFLLAIVVGSGIMADRLANGNTAVALLANTLATAAGLFVLILTLAPISGAHFNPVVTGIEVVGGKLPLKEGLFYVATQIVGAASGVAIANLMFELPAVLISAKVRTGPTQWLSEFVAAFGLVFFIAGAIRFKAVSAVALVVAAYISAAYWFTASTSFANPAATIARSLSDTFAGIRPADVPGFIAAQIVGGAFAAVVSRWLFAEKGEIR